MVEAKENVLETVKNYKRHIKFEKKTPDTHPKTGEVKETTIIDAYVYDGNIKLYGYGTYDEIKLTNSVTVEQIKEEMESQNFKVICDELRKNGIAEKIAIAKKKAAEQGKKTDIQGKKLKKEK